MSRFSIRSRNRGAIAGGIVGTLVALALIFLLLLWHVRRRRSVRQHWGYFDNGGGADRSGWMNRLLFRSTRNSDHVRSGSHGSTTSRDGGGRDYQSPFSDNVNRPDSSTEGHPPLEIPNFPPMTQIGARSAPEPAFTLVDVPSAAPGRSSPSDHSASGHGHSTETPTTTGSGFGFGRQAGLSRQEQQQSPPTSPFADPDPFRSTPSTTVVAQSNPSSSSTDSNHGMVSVASGQKERETPSPIHAATLPFGIPMPAPGVPIMKPMKATMVESLDSSHSPPPLPPSISYSSPQRVQSPRSPPAVAPKDMIRLTGQRESDRRTSTSAPRQPPLRPLRLPEDSLPNANPNVPSSLFASRHRTNTVNPFDDSNSIASTALVSPTYTPTHGLMGRSIDSTNKSSFISSGASVYSADETATDAGTDDGIPTINRRDRELHASDLYVPRAGDQRNSRALSSVSIRSLLSTSDKSLPQHVTDVLVESSFVDWLRDLNIRTEIAV